MKYQDDIHCKSIFLIVNYFKNKIMLNHSFKVHCRYLLGVVHNWPIYWLVPFRFHCSYFFVLLLLFVSLQSNLTEIFVIIFLVCIFSFRKNISALREKNPSTSVASPVCLGNQFYRQFLNLCYLNSEIIYFHLVIPQWL